MGTGLLLASDRAILVTIAPYMTDTGVSLQQASYMVSVVTGSALVGKLVVGYLAEFTGLRKLSLAGAGLHAMLLLLFVIQPGYWVLMGAVALVGVGLGGVLPITSMLIATNFGAASYGAVMGWMSLIIQPLGIIALRFTGEARDRTGSYDVAFLVFIGIVLVSTLLVWSIRRPQDHVLSPVLKQSEST